MLGNGVPKSAGISEVLSITTTFIVTINSAHSKYPVVKSQPPWGTFWNQRQPYYNGLHYGFKRKSNQKRARRDENESMGRAYGRGVGFYLGEPCEDKCNNILVHVYCNTTTRQCECKQDYPVKIQNRKCARASRLNEACEFNESCTYYDEHTVCGDDNKCRCTTNYIIKPGNENSEAVCIQGNNTGFLDNSDMTTMISVIAGLMIFTALFCLVLRLFSRARFNRPRDRIGNASGPSVVVSGLESAGAAGPNSASSSRRASRSSGSNQDHFKTRRHSCSATTLAPPSLSGSRRPSSTSVRSQGSLRSHGSSSFRSQGGSLRAPSRPGPSSGGGTGGASFRGYPALPGLSGGGVCSIHGGGGGGREPVRRTASSPASDTHHNPQIPATTSGAYSRVPLYGPAATTSSHVTTTVASGSSHSPSSMETATRTDSPQGASCIEAEIT